MLIKRGSKGTNVRTWQTFLIQQGLLSPPADGIFGPKTEQSTITYQRLHGLPPDGIVGPKTWSAAGLPELTIEQFKKLFPTNKEAAAWVKALNSILPKYDINTTLRIAAFLAQCGHESIGFTAVKENSNYSAEALTKTWPQHFPASIASQYARQPEKIANRAYANRMGNGSEASGDGWKYRGRGVIQLTGKDNYKAFANATGKTLEAVISYLETKEGAVESACWYWSTRNLNKYADNKDITGMTKIINGGTNGLADRQALYKKALSIFSS
ncbi:MAG: peptidoglycan-binding protein [Desulfuromonadales bacterium]|nr:peptidoglycan-binding protein [Desulfuromonadales bacterium]